MAARSRQLWHGLEAESGRVILHPVETERHGLAGLLDELAVEDRPFERLLRDALPLRSPAP